MTITREKDLWSGRPVWLSYPKRRLHTERLRRDIKTDVAVIGAGISGAMAAEELAAHGFSVAILDKRGPLEGLTLASTALLQYEIDTPLIKLARRIGTEDAMRAWRRSRLALENIAAKIASLQIDCAAARRPALYLPGGLLREDELEKEARARSHAGLYTEHLSRAALAERFGLHKSGALLTRANMAVNPLDLTAGFLQSALRNGAKIFAPETVRDMEFHTRGADIVTESGRAVHARHVVLATGHEVFKAIKCKSFKINSSWAIATKPQKSRLWPERAHIWQAASPYLYVRTTEDGRVVCGGEDEEFSGEEARDRLIPAKTRALEKKLKKLLPGIDAKAAYAWTGCFGESGAGLPLIGPVPGCPNCYAVMAFGGNGFTFSRIGAEIVLALLNGRADPEADLFAL
jgi:glycine/D-amino acid oxidase-like deaminating enzyme